MTKIWIQDKTTECHILLLGDSTQMFYQLRHLTLLEFHPSIWCDHKYWDSWCYTARCKHLTSTKNGKARLEFAKKCNGEPEEFWICVYGPMRQRWTSKWWERKNVEKKKGTAKDQAHSLICKAWWRWCHGMGMYDCLCRPSQLYWWINVWWQ